MFAKRVQQFFGNSNAIKNASLMTDRAPAPFNADYYAVNPDVHLRGTAVHSGRFVDFSTTQLDNPSKVSHVFDDSCFAPNIPSDPLYVLPRTKFTVNSESLSELATSILVGLQTLCPADTVLKTDKTKMKISVMVPGTLDVKVKILATESRNTYLVTCRRDSGDWFVFMQVFLAVKKYLRNQGTHVECHF